jgi:nucleoside-diphosphate-sugar epimerase
MSRNSVLITGAAGFIGSHLAEHCLSLGWRVTAVDCLTDYYSESVKRQNLALVAEHPNCRVIDADLCDHDLDLRPMLGGVSTIFHLAAQPGVRASWEQFDTYSALNLNATQRLLDAARGGGSLERFVLASSSSVYGDAETMPTPEDLAPRPVSPYGVTKVAAEHLARAYWRGFGVPTVCLRYFTVYGPRQRPDMAFNRLIECVLLEKPFEVFGDGNQTRDFTFVADAVSGTLAAGLRGVPGAAYNIGGGSRRSINDVLATLEELLGRPVARTYHPRQLGDARDTAAEITLARRELGYEPQRDFAAGLKEQLDWQRDAMLTPELPL